MTGRGSRDMTWIKTDSKSRGLNRRTFLRGTFGGVLGATIGLPLLEAMLDGPSLRAQDGSGTTPRRYVVCFAGSSLGAGRLPVLPHLVPETFGANYALPACLQPLSTRGVAAEVTAVSNLRISTDADNNGVVPPGGRTRAFHGANIGPLLCGMRADEPGHVGGPSSDQIVAEALGRHTAFDALNLRVQAATYVGDNSQSGGKKGTISFAANGPGKGAAVAPRVDPRGVFDTVFGGFDPDQRLGEAERQAREEMRQRQISVLDVVHDSYVRLRGRLSATDRQRLERHLDEIRQLEQRVQLFEQEQAACQAPKAPAESWPVAGGQAVDSQQRTDNFQTSLSYSNEVERADILSDVLYQALACDLTRVATLQYTMFQSFMSAEPICGITRDIHELGHSSQIEAIRDIIRWHVDQFAALAARLQSAPEADGTLLDHTALVLLFEGGHGRDPESGREFNTHSTENMFALTAGGAGGLVRGQHLDGAGAHPARVLLTAMKAAGVETDALGEVTGVVPGLLAG